jgi:hypothetical protein
MVDAVAWVAKEAIQREAKSVGYKLGLSNSKPPEGRKKDHAQRKIDRQRARQDAKIAAGREVRLAASEHRREELQRKYLTPRESDTRGVQHDHEQPGCFARIFCCCVGGDRKHTRLNESTAEQEQPKEEEEEGEAEEEAEEPKKTQKKTKEKK